MIKLSKKNRIEFIIVFIVYLLVVIWISNYWLIAGLGIIYDYYISKKVNWTFWKKRNGNNNAFIEWFDAIIFAVIAVTLINIFIFQNYKIPTPSMEKSLLIGDHLLVSKVAYGPRMPNTPIAFPFTQHTMPLTKGKSWSNLVLWPYKRLAGCGKIKNNDPIVFNFPAGDTVVLEEYETSYYEIVRMGARDLKMRDSYSGVSIKSDDYYLSIARKEIWDRFHVIYRPVDRRDPYVKRCIGIPGDTISIQNGDLYVNGKLVPDNSDQQTTYIVQTNGTKINPKAFERLHVYRSDQRMISSSEYYLPLTKSVAEKISKFTNVTSVIPIIDKEGEWASHIFPHDSTYHWNQDNFGPLWIPKKGSIVHIDTSNICLYDRIIDVYEDNDLKIDGSTIYINGVPSDTYTFKMDYYWMMGDNRHNSADSRFWGFVPEDHVIGKPKFIWLSLDKEAHGLKSVRLGRMFKKIE